MDESEGALGGASGFGESGDPTDQFHRNEAISAVADEGFLGEEDDDYEDLYNDVNVGEGFLQSLRKNEDVEFRNGEENRAQLQMAAAPSRAQPLEDVESAGAPIPGIGGGGETERKYEREIPVGGAETMSTVPGVSFNAYQNQGFRGNDAAKGPVAPGPGMDGGGPPSAAASTGGSYGGGGGLRVELGQPSNKVGDLDNRNAINNNNLVVQRTGQHQQPHTMVGTGNLGNDIMPRQSGVGGNINASGGNMGGGASAASGGPGHNMASGGIGGSTILFVGDLHWWTTDAELEDELVKYGPVKEFKFFDEKASGKSKGYCQVEFYDPTAATSCKEGMNGHLFNGRACVVAFASPLSVKRMGEAQVNRNQQQTNHQPVPQGRRPNEPVSKPTGNSITTGANYQGGDSNRGGFGRGSWGRGAAQGMGRGPMGPMRNRPGGMGGRGIMGNGGGGFGPGMGPGPPMMHPQAMMGQGFDPAFGGPMGRMGAFGGFPGAGPTPPFSGLMPTFPPVGNVGLPGVAPHVNPAFFGRGMPMNGMGMMPNAGVDGPGMGMWQDPNMGGGWAGDDHIGRAGESSYAEEAVSDHQYGEANHDRAGWPNNIKEKDRGSERDWSGSSERRYRDEREPGYEREMPREKEVSHDQDWPERRNRDDRDAARDRERDRPRERERSRDKDRERDRERSHDRDRERDRHREDRHGEHHRHRDREPEHDDEWDRGRSSRTHSRTTRLEEDQRSRSRDADYGKRRRITSN